MALSQIPPKRRERGKNTAKLLSDEQLIGRMKIYYLNNDQPSMENSFESWIDCSKKIQKEYSEVRKLKRRVCDKK